MSDRDITYYNKSFIDPQGIKKFNQKVLNTFINFKPDIIVLCLDQSDFQDDQLKNKIYKYFSIEILKSFNIFSANCNVFQSD